MMTAVAAQAQSDRIDAIRERASTSTRDTLIRFGRLKALSGGNLGLDMSNFGKSL